MSKILQMLMMQQKLNDDTNGEGWESGTNRNGKRIDWNRCIYLEAAELIESYPWKHWKNIDSSPDYDNIKIEIVDIWHFVMSEALRHKNIPIKDLARKIEDMEAFKSLQLSSSPKTTDIYAQIELVENLIETIFKKNGYEELISSFMIMSSNLGLGLGSLYELYIGKNVLNNFRQDNGYKTGEYRKIWDGKEDNEVMHEILAANKDIEPLDLYEALQIAYSQTQ